MTALLLLVLTQFPLDVFDNATAFERMEAKDNWVLSKRAIAGSPFAEHRMEVQTTQKPADLCHAIYEWGTRHNDGPGITLSKLLKDGEDVRVVYTQLSQPVVARRDYAMTVKREHLDGGRCRIRFRTTNAEAPEKPEGFVRLEHVWGEWKIDPAEGGAKVTYTLYSDPGGSVPAFLVHGSLAKSTRESALTGVEKTRTWVESGRP